MMEQGPNERRLTETDIDFESADPKEITGISEERAEAIAARLDQMLDADTPKTEEVPESPVGEEEARALYDELKNGLDSDADIELLSSDEAVERVYTKEYIEKAKDALDKMFPNEGSSEADNESTR